MTALPPRRLRAQRAGRPGWLAWLLASLVFLPVLGVVGVSLDVGWQLTHPARQAVSSSPADFGLSFDAVAFPSREDGTVLRGWWIPAQPRSGQETLQPSDRTIILAHGYRNNREQSDVPGLAVAKGLATAGYNVLTFDFRGSGSSGGKLVSVGYFEQRDLLGAFDFVRSKPVAGRHIAVLGWSLGASTALLAAAREPGIEAVVADSPFADLSSYLNQHLSLWTHLPAQPFNLVILGLMPLIEGIDIGQVSPLKALPALARRPVLLIAGLADHTIPARDSELLVERLRSLGNTRAQLWEVSGAGHVKAYAAAPDAYLRQVLNFLQAAMGS